MRLRVLAAIALASEPGQPLDALLRRDWTRHFRNSHLTGFAERRTYQGKTGIAPTTERSRDARNQARGVGSGTRRHDPSRAAGEQQQQQQQR